MHGCIGAVLQDPETRTERTWANANVQAANLQTARKHVDEAHERQPLADEAMRLRRPSRSGAGACRPRRRDRELPPVSSRYHRAAATPAPVLDADTTKPAGWN